MVSELYTGLSNNIFVLKQEKMSLFLQEDLRKTRENWWIKKGQKNANNEAADVLARWERAGKRSRVYEGEGECVCLKQQTEGGEVKVGSPQQHCRRGKGWRRRHHQ